MSRKFKRAMEQEFKIPGKPKKTDIKLRAICNKPHGGTWYLHDDIKFFPQKQDEFLSQDIPGILKDIYCDDEPQEPIFKKNSVVLNFGSCFADRCSRLFADTFRSQFLEIPSGLHNTYAVKEFLNWVLHGQASTGAYLYKQAGKWTPKDEGDAAKKVIDGASGFIISVGLAEVWCETETGQVFWRGVPKEIFSREAHHYEITTPADNANNMLQIQRMLSPDGSRPVLWVLCPVPLNATWKDSAFVSDCLSKSIMRVAIDKFMSYCMPGAYYWPAFEQIKWLGAHLDNSTYGADNSTRHPDNWMLKYVTDEFKRRYVR